MYYADPYHKLYSNQIVQYLDLQQSGQIVGDWEISVLQIIRGLEQGKLCIIDVSLHFLCNNYFVEM